MKLNLQVRQSQKFIMTQELRQSIDILTYDILELDEFLREESYKNPTLVYENPSAYKEEIEFDKYVSRPLNLYEFLYRQVSVLDLSEEQKELVNLLVSSINQDTGYMDKESLRDLGYIGEEKLQGALEIVYDLEPWGIGALNLIDCLLIQAKKRTFSQVSLDIIKNNLEDINKDPNILGEKYGLSKKAVISIIDDIKSLNPRPINSIALYSEPCKYIFEELRIIKDGQNYYIDYVDSYLPRLSIDPYYENMVKKDLDQETGQYLKSMLNKSRQLLDAVSQRRSTIQAVAAAIVKSQSAYFFDSGDLKPMTMKDIADYLDLHESTISRSVNGKYIESPRGIYELRSFFTSSLASKDGNISNQAIKSKIKVLIGKENKKEPLSDQQIGDILNSQGIKISRRTVAKYRKELSIASSRERKVYY